MCCKARLLRSFLQVATLRHGPMARRSPSRRSCAQGTSDMWTYLAIPFSLRDIWATLLLPKWAEIFVAQMAGDETSLPYHWTGHIANLKSHWNPLLQKAARSLIVVRTREHFTETRNVSFLFIRQTQPFPERLSKRSISECFRENRRENVTCTKSWGQKGGKC